MRGEQIGCRLRHSERMVAVVLQKIFGHLRNISECAPRHLYLPRPFCLDLTTLSQNYAHLLPHMEDERTEQVRFVLEDISFRLTSLMV